MCINYGHSPRQHRRLLPGLQPLAPGEVRCHAAAHIAGTALRGHLLGVLHCLAALPLPLHSPWLLPGPVHMQDERVSPRHCRNSVHAAIRMSSALRRRHSTNISCNDTASTHCEEERNTGGCRKRTPFYSDLAFMSMINCHHTELNQCDVVTFRVFVCYVLCSVMGTCLCVYGCTTSCAVQGSTFAQGCVCNTTS